jgi:FMN phosphatase YigB (HAD superfamily)
MTETQRYVLTQDTPGLFRNIDQNFDPIDSNEFNAASGLYLQQIQEQLQTMFQDTEVAGFTEAEIERRLMERVGPLMESDPKALCICLDRFLLQTLEENPELTERFVRFGICRTASGERVPRQTMASFAEQISVLHSRFPDLQQRNVIVVDDGLFSGQTVERVRELFSHNGDALNITNIIGFIGNTELVDDDTLAVSEVLQPENNLRDWVDIRDLGPLGGRMLDRSRTGRLSTAIPYIFPWSEGQGASMQDSPAFFDVSLQMIRAFRDLTEVYEASRGGIPLTIRELVKAGYPFPTDLKKTIPISINDTLIDYLTRCEERVIYEQNREVTIFDMDGTLYEMNGGEGFTGSILESTINQRALQFICEREGIDQSEGLLILQDGLNDEVGLSNFLAARYGITRNDYFDFAWDIDPAGIVENYEAAEPTIRALMEANPERKMILLTSAPRVWARRVLDYIGVSDCFEDLYTGESYKTKEDIFSRLAGRYRPENVMSVGDQLKTDIEPAQAVGFNTLQVRTPADLQLLIQ